MGVHEEVRELLGAWALGACDDDEARLVAWHIGACPECRSEAATLRGATDLLGQAWAEPPPSSARARLLASAGYRTQIDELGMLLESLDGVGWATPVAGHGSIRALVFHLSRNDGALLRALPAGAGSGPSRRDLAGAPAGEWRDQADVLAGRLETATATVTRLVPLAGSAGFRRPVREAMVQRMFETWVHAEDVRRVLALPPRTPSPEGIRQIAELGLGLLPDAMGWLGRAHPGCRAEIELSGPGGGSWTVDLSRANGLNGSSNGRVVCTLMAGAVDFCRLMAGRLHPSVLPHTATGHPRVIGDLLYAASMLGCDANG